MDGPGWIRRGFITNNRTSLMVPPGFRKVKFGPWTSTRPSMVVSNASSPPMVVSNASSPPMIVSNASPPSVVSLWDGVSGKVKNATKDLPDPKTFWFSFEEYWWIALIILIVLVLLVVLCFFGKSAKKCSCTCCSPNCSKVTRGGEDN